MRYEDERYVRLYTRKTIGWRMLPWQSKALLPLLLREVDRAGLLDLDEYGAQGVAVAVEMPLEVVEPGLKGLIDAGTVELRGSVLVLPNFLEAQEAVSSDAQRKRDQRERARAETKLNELKAVTPRDGESRVGTNSHAQSRAVTDSHSDLFRSEPSVPSDPTEETLSASPPGLKFDFEAVYAKYPRKEGKKRGMARCKAQITTPEKYAALVKAVENYAAGVRELQYAKHFSSFMLCWEDYVDRKPVTGERVSSPTWQGRPIGRGEVGTFTATNPRANDKL